MNMQTKLVAVLLAGIIFWVGCSRQDASVDSSKDLAATSESAASAEQEELLQVTPLDKLFAEVESLYYEGNTNGAISRLDAALENPEFADERRRIFSMAVRMEIEAGDIAAARSRMLNAYKNNVEIVDDAVGAVYYYYNDSGDHSSAVEWTDEVLAVKNLPSSIVRNLREWNFLSVILVGSDDRAVKIARSLVAAAPAGDAINILRRGSDLLMERKMTNVVARILDDASHTVTSDSTTRTFLASLRLRLYAERGEWAELQKNFKSLTSSFSDSDLLFILRRTVPAAARASKEVLIGELCLGVITNSNFQTRSYVFTARQWLLSAQRTDIMDIPERLDFLLSRGKVLGEVGVLFVHHAYDGVDNVEFVKEMRPIGERLVAPATDEDTKSAIRTALLDYCFVLNDFDSAIAILEKGIAGYDKPWHEMAISKVKAHKALNENRPLDAIKEFRAFMAVMGVAEDAETSDPATGITHTREMILGRNAKRIGDIYASIPDMANAVAAYNEARAYYQKTLDSSSDKDVIAIVKEEMAQIPNVRAE